MFTLPSKPMAATSVLSVSLSLYKSSICRVLSLSLISSILIFSPFLGHFLLGSFSGMGSEIYSDITSLLFTIFAWLLAYILMTAIIFRQHCIAHHIETTLKATLTIALKNFIPLIALGVLYSVIVFCGTILLIFPGVILAISLMFCFLLKITDQTPILDSLLQSHRLVWGSWWRTTILISIPLLFNLALIQFIFLAVLSLFSHEIASTERILFFAFVGITIVQTFLYPLVFSVYLMILHDLKLRKILSA